jgi:hypothetical protein
MIYPVDTAQSTICSCVSGEAGLLEQQGRLRVKPGRYERDEIDSKNSNKERLSVSLLHPMTRPLIVIGSGVAQLKAVVQEP